MASQDPVAPTSSTSTTRRSSSTPLTVSPARRSVSTATGITRNVDAQGTTNTFNIQGAGASGPSGSLVGDSATNAFVFSGSSKLIGSIQGGGSSTLNDSAYSSGVTVKLGNGTNGTATGVSGTVTGITAVIGSNFNDTLNAGTVPNVALTGGLGTNTLSGTGAGDSVVESISSSYTLTNASLTGTGVSFTDNLTGIKVAALSGVGATATFTVSGWTGSGSLTAPAGTGTVTASKAANYTLTNTSLSSTDGMSLTLSGITTANLAVTGAGHTFTESGWTGSGSLTGTTATVAASNASGFTLSPTSLTAGPMSLTLSGITTANLTDTRSGGGNTFTINGWTGKGSLSGSSDSLVEGVSSNVTLTNASLAVTGHPHSDLDRDHHRQPHRHGRRQYLHGQRLDGKRVAHRQSDHGGHGGSEQERRLHADKQFAVIHRWHVAQPVERHHDRQPHGQRQRRQYLHRQRLDGWWNVERRDRDAGRQHLVQRRFEQHVPGRDGWGDTDLERVHDGQPHRHGRR